MTHFLNQLLAAKQRFGGDKVGATAIEYGLLAAGISVVIIGTVFLLGPTLDSVFNSVLLAMQQPPAGT